MGLIFPDAQNLLETRQGLSGGKAVTLGRLTAYFHPSEIRALRRYPGLDAAAHQWLDAYKWGDKADGFFIHLLKFDTLDSIDFSEYEGATIVHDLSKPLPPALERKFDLAYDGGTLEHVFNFPVAIGNLMRLVREGGLAYTLTPCNNMAGHGFYQFSPELMYRVFSRENGFEPVFVRLVEARYRSVEMTSGHKIYNVVDPQSAGGRVNLTNCHPVLITAMARCVRVCEPFQSDVLQSDYAVKWNNGKLGSGQSTFRSLGRRYLPKGLWTLIRGTASLRRASFSNKSHYKRV